MVYNYLCNECPSPITLWVRIPIKQGVFYTTLCEKVFQWLVAGRWFSPGTSTKKTDLPRYNWTIVESSGKHHKPYRCTQSCIIARIDHFVLSVNELWYLLYFNYLNHLSSQRWQFMLITYNVICHSPDCAKNKLETLLMRVIIFAWLSVFCQLILLNSTCVLKFVFFLK
jgi:hypothetical protein